MLDAAFFDRFPLKTIFFMGFDAGFNFFEKINCSIYFDENDRCCELYTILYCIIVVK